MWQVSRILGCSPFSPDLLTHSAQQLDFILEMHAEDHPKQYRFNRDGAPLDGPARDQAWERVLLGAANDEVSRPRNFDALAAKLEALERRQQPVVAMGPAARR